MDIDTLLTATESIPPSWAFGLQWIISIIFQLLIAAAAIWAALSARSTLRQAKAFKQSDQYSQRAFVTADSVPGRVTFDHPKRNIEKIEIILVNTGNNPLSNGIAHVYLCGHPLDPKPQHSELKGFNPLATNQEWKLILKDMLHPQRGHIQHIRVDIFYHDIKLDEDFTQSFFWTVNEDGFLGEAIEFIRLFLKSMELGKDEVISAPRL